MASLCFHYDVEAFGKIFGESLPSTKFSFYRKGFLDLGEELMYNLCIYLKYKYICLLSRQSEEIQRDCINKLSLLR